MELEKKEKSKKYFEDKNSKDEPIWRVMAERRSQSVPWFLAWGSGRTVRSPTEVRELGRKYLLGN